MHTEDELTSIIDVLRRSDLCADLTDVELRQIATSMQVLTCPSGQVICRQEEHGDLMFIVARGRVKLILEQGGLEYRLLEYLDRGEHFNELAMLTDGHHTSTAIAVMDCELLTLDHADFHRLMSSVPGFAANLSRSLGLRLQRQATGRRRRRRPRVIGIIRSTYRTEQLLDLMSRELAGLGDSVLVMTDRRETWPTDGVYAIERIPEETAQSELPALLHGRLMQVIEHHDRVLLDLAATQLETVLPGLLAQCEQVLWLVEARFADVARKDLSTLLASDPKLAARTHVVWVLTEPERFSPPPIRDLGLHNLDFKIVLDPNPRTNSRCQKHGVTRLVRHLRGTRIGLALGGGGARGLSHLGVIRGLEKADIFFDLLAGTSSGALMGLSYAAGWPPQQAIDEFREALTPNRLVRALPGGSTWYLVVMFRSGAWDRMLRPYLEETTLEQLQVPFSTVAADLISGQPIVRDTGDAISAVLESINVPGISRPIMRDGMALIDGGTLNNMPSSVLAARGADFIVAVDVVNKLQPKFGGNTPATPTHQMRKPGMFETLWRTYEMQDHAGNELRTGPVDLLITPDTSVFEFADFSQGVPLADVGEAAAEEIIPQLKQMLADLQRKE